jgi:hypothetical protein
VYYLQPRYVSLGVSSQYDGESGHPLTGKVHFKINSECINPQQGCAGNSCYHRFALLCGLPFLAIIAAPRPYAFTNAVDKTNQYGAL